MIEDVDDGLRQPRQRIVFLRAPCRVAETAHVHGDHLAIRPQRRTDIEPVVRKIRKSVNDQDRRLSPTSEFPEVNRGVTRRTASRLMGNRHYALAYYRKVADAGVERREIGRRFAHQLLE